MSALEKLDQIQDISGISSSLSRLVRLFDDIDAKSKTLMDSQGKQEESIREIRASIDGLKTSIHELQNSAADIQNKEENLRELRDDTQKKIDALDDKIQQFSQDSEELKQLLGQGRELIQQTGASDRAIKEIRREMRRLDKRIDELNGEISRQAMPGDSEASPQMGSAPGLPERTAEPVISLESSTKGTKESDSYNTDIQEMFGIAGLCLHRILSRQHQAASVASGANSTDQALLMSDNYTERGFIALEDGDWERAEEFFEQALDLQPHHARAYLGKALLSSHLHSVEDIIGTKVDITESKDFIRAFRFANGDLLPILNGIVALVHNDANNDETAGVLLGK